MTTEKPISRASFFKIILLWLPIALWYLAGFSFSHFYLFFHQVDAFYYHAGNHWLHQKPLYNGEGNGFVYFPTTAALLSPLTLLPLKPFELIYRIISVSILTLGIYAFATHIGTKNIKQTFFITLLATMLPSQAAIFVGQLHIMTTGLMLLAYTKIAREQYWGAAILLALSLALKPTSIILFLLALGIFPKLSLRLLLITVIVFGLSFILQSPDYVLSQYASFANSFHVAMHHDADNPQQWATFFGMLAFYTHWHIDGTPQFITRIIFAGIVFALCWIAKRRFTIHDAIYFIVALGMCYLMLFNSRTESNDYIMVTPLVGYSLALAYQQKNRIAIYGLSTVILFIAASWNLSKWLTPHNNIWINPTVISFYVIYLLKSMYLNSKQLQNKK